MDSVEERVKKALVEKLGCEPEKIVPEAEIQKDLGADSLDAVEITMGMEEEFGVEIKDDEAEGIITVGDLIAIVKAKGGK